MDRRRFLSTTAGVLGSHLVFGCSTDEPPALAPSSNPFGVARPEDRDLFLPQERQPEAMLEVFLLGGMSPWETFYVVPEHGNTPDNPQQWHTFQNRGRPTIPDFISQCGQPGRALYEPWTNTAGVPRLDALGARINLGPFIYAFRDRPDMLARMRVWVMNHELEPHEAAIPLAITGLPRGNPRQAAMGAHVQRFHQEQSPVRSVPWSYVLYQSSFAIDNNGDAGSAVGLHRAAARPMSIHIRPGAPLADQLPRPSVNGFRQPLDDLVDHYAARLQSRYASLRAPGLADFRSARSGMRQHAALQGLLPAQALEASTLSVCSTDFAPPIIKGNVLDETTASLRLATQLLTAPENRARYTQVIEGGIFPDPEGQGYDSHAWHVEQQGINLNHMADALSAQINRPGENDPSKLDLDRHFVLLNTEFGRTPTPEFSVRNPEGYGTDHWPWGYVVVGFGGFVTEERAGVVGAIQEDARAYQGISPTAHRAAMLLALGIWPFHEAGFAIGDIAGATTEREAATFLRNQVLGYTS